MTPQAAISGSNLAHSAGGDPSLTEEMAAIRDSWVTGAVIALKAVSGICDDSSALAAAAANDWSSLTGMHRVHSNELDEKFR